MLAHALVLMSLSAASLDLTQAAGAVVSAPAVASAEGQHAGEVDFQSGATDSGWLPLEATTAARIFFPVTVNGHAAIAFLDSGSPVMTLSQTFASQLDLRRGGDVVAEGIGGSTKSAETKGVVIQVGALTIRPRASYILDYSALEKSMHHALPIIIGGAAFRETVVDIDFPHRRIAFRAPASFQPPPGAAMLQLKPVQGNMAVSASVEGRSVNVMFDLRNGSPLLLYPDFWNRPAFVDNHRFTEELSSGLGGRKVQGLAMVGPVQVGESAFPKMPAMLLRSTNGGGEVDGVSGNIGLPVWDRSRLIVDFPQSRVYVVPPVESSNLFPVDHVGVATGDVDGGEQILLVAPGSPAMGSGLQVGDVIVSVKSAKTSLRLALNSKWQDAEPGTVLDLTLKGGKIIRLTTKENF